MYVQTHARFVAVYRCRFHPHHHIACASLAIVCKSSQVSLCFLFLVVVAVAVVIIVTSHLFCWIFRFAFSWNFPVHRTRWFSAKHAVAVRNCVSIYSYGAFVLWILIRDTCCCCVLFAPRLLHAVKFTRFVIHFQHWPLINWPFYQHNLKLFIILFLCFSQKLFQKCVFHVFQHLSISITSKFAGILSNFRYHMLVNLKSNTLDFVSTVDFKRFSLHN